MKYAFIASTLLATVAMAGCDNRPAVVTVPTPTTTVPVPGPAGPAGAQGPAGQTGGSGTTNVIVTPPASAASR